MKGVKFSKWLGLFIFIGLISFVSLYKPEINKMPEKKGNPPDFAFEDVTITQIEEGNRVWEIKSKYAEIDKEKNKVKMNKMQGEVYDQSNNLIISFNSPESIMFMETANMELINAKANFLVEDEWISLSADEIYWQSKKKLLTSKKNVQIKSKTLRINGDYLQATIPAKKVKMLGRSSAEIQSHVIK